MDGWLDGWFDVSKMHFTECWCPLSSRPREMRVCLRSSKGSLEPSVSRFLWWLFNLSSNTSRYACNEFRVEGFWVECKHLMQSCNSFCISFSHAPLKALCALSHHSCSWHAFQSSVYLCNSLWIGLSAAESGFVGSNSALCLLTPFSRSAAFLASCHLLVCSWISNCFRSSLPRTCFRCPCQRLSGCKCNKSRQESS